MERRRRWISRAYRLAIIPAAAAAVAGAVTSAAAAHADCLEDFQRVAAAQIVALDNQDQIPSRAVTARVDTKTGKVIASVTTEHAPPDRTRTTLESNGTREVTVTTHDRLWIGHGGPLQEVPTSTAKERIEDAHRRLLAFRASLAAADWKTRAKDLACTTDATLDGKPAERFTFIDGETGLPTTLFADPKTFDPLRTEATATGFKIVQTITRDPNEKIELPQSP